MEKKNSDPKRPSCKWFHPLRNKYIVEKRNKNNYYLLDKCRSCLGRDMKELPGMVVMFFYKLISICITTDINICQNSWSGTHDICAFHHMHILPKEANLKKCWTLVTCMLKFFVLKSTNILNLLWMHLNKTNWWMHIDRYSGDTCSKANIKK